MRRNKLFVQKILDISLPPQFRDPNVTVQQYHHVFNFIIIFFLIKERITGRR